MLKRKETVWEQSEIRTLALADTHHDMVGVRGFYLTRKSFAVAKVEMGEGTAIGLTTLQRSWIDGLM